MSKLIKKTIGGMRVFLIEDEDLLAWSIETELTAVGVAVTRAANLKDAVRLFPDAQADIVITDLKLPDGSGLDLLQKWKREFPQIPIILITAHGAIDSAIAALRHGAFDYLQKPFEMQDLLIALGRASEVASLRQKLQSLTGRFAASSAVEMIGSSPALESLRTRLHKIAQSRADTAMIVGESGVGKELAARAVHDWSERKDQPFVEINCASIPDTLLESELFGHEKGAFTDARDRKLGLFEIVQKGTIFLDEIGEMPAKLQAKLLRVLEVKRFRRLGGVKDINLEARVVVATHCDLKKMIRTNEFRADLYFRLHVMPVKIPPLRQRTEDVIELSQFFLNRFALESARASIQLSPCAKEKLKQYSWPGNIRELKNVLQRATILYDQPVLTADHLELDFEDVPDVEHASEMLGSWHERQASDPQLPIAKASCMQNQDTLADSTSQRADNIASASPFSLPEEGVSLDAVEKKLLTQAMERARYNQTKAAHLLGISRHTLRYRLDKYAILAEAPILGATRDV